MFQFPGLAAMHLCIQCMLIQESRAHHLFVGSPKLFADFHAFHRLSIPRHPPCALSNLTIGISNLNPISQPLTYAKRPLHRAASDIRSHTHRHRSNSHWCKPWAAFSPIYFQLRSFEPVSITPVILSNNQIYFTGFKLSLLCTPPSNLRFEQGKCTIRCHLPIQPNCQRSIPQLAKPFGFHLRGVTMLKV